MNTTNKFDDSDLQFLLNLFTLVSNYVEEMIKLNYTAINKCDDIKEIIYSIVKDSVHKEEVINKLMLAKAAETIDRNPYNV